MILNQVCKYLIEDNDVMSMVEKKPIKIHLGAASKRNRRSTGGSVRFLAVAIVKNNRNRPEPDGTAGQPTIGFGVVP